MQSDSEKLIEISTKMTKDMYRHMGVCEGILGVSRHKAAETAIATALSRKEIRVRFVDDEIFVDMPAGYVAECKTQNIPATSIIENCLQRGSHMLTPQQQLA